MTHGYAFLFGMLGAMMILLLNHFIVDHPTKVVTIDINYIVHSFVKNEMQKNISQKNLDSETKSFGDELEKNIKQYAKRHHVIFVPKEAVYAGAIDYTNLFLTESGMNQ